MDKSAIILTSVVINILRLEACIVFCTLCSDRQVETKRGGEDFTGEEMADAECEGVHDGGCNAFTGSFEREQKAPLLC